MKSFIQGIFIGFIISSPLLFVIYKDEEKKNKQTEYFESLGNEKIINAKYSTDWWGNPLPTGLCKFYYVYRNGTQEFTDSCHFYKVGDTIK